MAVTDELMRRPACLSAMTHFLLPVPEEETKESMGANEKDSSESNLAASPKQGGFFKKLLRPPDKKRSSSLADDHVGSREFVEKQQKDKGSKFVPREEHPLWKKQQEEEGKKGSNRS